jgi:flagellar hook-basal body complex protein FliE
MNVDAVTFLSPELALPEMPEMAGPPEPARTGSDFAAWMQGEFEAVNARLVAADQGVRALASGVPVDLHRVMIDMEQAKLSLQLMLQVRNHVLEAYQDMVKMPI